MAQGRCAAAGGYAVTEAPKGLIATMKQVRREAGWKGLFQRYGWKLVAGFIVYYLVRDVTLYILLPYLIVKGACV